MRDIKFRAWDKHLKAWAIFELGWSFDKTKGHIVFHPMPCPEISEYLEIGQYTGLKDKNGVEIYEDDNLKIVLDSGTYISPVMKRHGCWVIYHPYRLDMHTGDKDYINFGWWTSHDNVEVIGNIHEPEPHT